MQRTASTLAGKRLLITGANGGLGMATTAAALREGAHVTLACRTEEKAGKAADHALSESRVEPSRAVAAGGFDMLAPSAIESAVDALPAEPFDVVFLQAGGWVWSDDAQTTRFGAVNVERTIAKNVLGAHATLRALLATGRLGAGARVVIIGGEGARGVPGGISTPAFSDVSDFERYVSGDWVGRSPYVPVDALGVAKFCAALWALKLSKSPLDLDVVWFTPGLIGGTGGTNGMPAWKEFLFQKLAFPLMVALGKAQWPEAAAAKCVDCLAGRIGADGDLLGAPEGTALGPLTDQKPMHPQFGDADFQDALWRTCEAAVGPLTVAHVPSALAV
ncbi:MAG: SDR family NAD(P)-dependent oxidoreductase [Proteobacteria bacterium]|nr:SDR family NAD(P)-dependent oxidoreductase [Pseudomonadota bacterium]